MAKTVYRQKLIDNWPVSSGIKITAIFYRQSIAYLSVVMVNEVFLPERFNITGNYKK